MIPKQQVCQWQLCSLHAEQAGLAEFARARCKMHTRKRSSFCDTSVLKLANTPTSLLKVIQSGEISSALQKNLADELSVWFTQQKKDMIYDEPYN